MRVIEKRVLNIEHRAYDYKEFIYIEIWHNNRLKDNYFCFVKEVYPNGQPRANALKYFYSSASAEDIQKEVKPIPHPSQFKSFDKLYHIDEKGEVWRIDGKAAAECDYVQEALDIIEAHDKLVSDENRRI